jgi:hypothetical protein
LAVGLYSIIIVLGLTGNLMFCHIVISSAGKWTKLKPLSNVVFYFEIAVLPQGADLRPAPSTRGQAGRNHLKDEIAPLLPTGIGERFSQTISNLGCELPL